MEVEQIEVQVEQIGPVDDPGTLGLAGDALGGTHPPVLGLTDLFVQGDEVGLARLALQELEERVADDAVAPVAEGVRLLGLKAMGVPVDVEEDLLQHVVRIDVDSAEDMLRETLDILPETDVLISAAASADFRPKETHGVKLKKESGKGIELERTPDVLKAVGERRTELNMPRLVVGFAAGFVPALGAYRARITDMLRTV